MRSYRQFCALARALDVVGERWTLLVVRELLPGPRRFSELLDGLPGIGPNLLSSRLQRLEREGLLTREVLRPPASSRVYVLTERGRALDESLLALARWGIDGIEPPRGDDRLEPAWYALAMRAAFTPGQADGLEGEFEFRAGPQTFHLAVQEGAMRAAYGSAHSPQAVLSTGVERLLRIFSGGARPDAGELQGDAALMERLIAACTLTEPVARREPSPAPAPGAEAAAEPADFAAPAPREIAQIVVFTVAGEEYALPVDGVREIIRYSEPRRISSASPWVRGVISLRGEILPVCEIASRLGPPQGASGDGEIVVLDGEQGAAGVIVEEIREVATISPGQIEQIPGAGSDLIAAVVRLADRLVILLDEREILAGVDFTRAPAGAGERKSAGIY